MFNSILLRHSLPGTPNVDIGLMAECLLFYDNVHLIAGMATLENLVKVLGLNVLEELVKQKHLTLSFYPFVSGTHTKAKSTPQECFDYCYVIPVPGKKREPDFEALFFKTLEAGSGKKGKSRRVGNRIFSDVNIIEPEKLIPIEKGIPEIARQNLADEVFLSSAIKTSLQYLAPSYNLPQDFEFIVFRHENGFDLQTNINFVKLNKLRNRNYFPDPKSKLCKAYLLDTILKANEDVFFSAHFESDIVTQSITSSIMELKFSNILKHVRKNVEEEILFKKIVLPEAKIIREVINEGKKEFEDILPLLENSKKFNNWLQSQESSTTVINEYYKAISKNSWIEKLPSKTLRFTILTGTGILADTLIAGGWGTTIGVTLSLGDNFILEKLAKGWKPDQYVNEIKKFVQ